MSKKIRKICCDFQKKIENRKKSKIFIENQYKHFQKSRKNLEKIEIFSTFLKIFILIFNENFEILKFSKKYFFEFAIFSNFFRQEKLIFLDDFLLS